jgi:hypothetical protein
VFAAMSRRGRFEETPKGKHVGKLLLAAIAMVAVSTSAQTERKRDVLGLYPGMSYEEAMSAMAKICKGKTETVESANGAISIARCSLGKRLENPAYPLDEEGLEVEFAVHISKQSTVHVVRYFFQLNVEIFDLVKSLFAQFGFPCESRSGYETCYPARLYRASPPLNKDLLDVSLLLDPPTRIEQMPVSGPMVAGLWLSLNMFPSDYRGILELRDVTLSDAENAARRAPPKF